MVQTLTQEQSAQLQRILLGVIVLAAAWYGVRAALALILAGLGRGIPACRALAVRCAPAAIRPVIRRAVAGGLVGAALASPAALADPGAPPCAGGDLLVPVLDRACAPAPASDVPLPEPDISALPPSPAAAAAEVRRVERGDSLWRIADQLLQEPHSAADVALAWPKLWQANRALIGEEPGRIMPGTDLVVPEELRSGA